MNKDLRVRFAPSPTGTLHVGNARTALFNYLFAKKYNGTFVLRVEDTDQERSSAESESSILHDLKWLGLTWDEGPDCGGDFGPYRQSDRLNTYSKYTTKLLETGSAYHCFCTADELEKTREKQRKNKETPHYPGTCRNIPREIAKQRLVAGEPAVLRYKIEQDEVSFADDVRGNVVFNAETLGGDFIIVKGDGFPTYNFAVVVDDALMKINTVIRGEDHLTNTAKQLLLYDTLQFERPRTFHLSMILGPDRSKLSKRHGSTSVAEFRNKGFLHEAVFNYLALLGWNNGDDKELYEPSEIEVVFDYDRINKSAAVFDYSKLTWINGRKLRELSEEDFVSRAIKYLKTTNTLPNCWTPKQLEERLPAFQEKIETFADLADYWPIFEQSSVSEDADVAGWIAAEENQNTFVQIKQYIQASDALTIDFGTLKKEVQTNAGVKGKDLFMPLRIALTGRLHGPDLGVISQWLDVKKVLKRIDIIVSKHV